jgi:hypothetical protein
MKGYPRSFKKTLLTSSALLYLSGALLAPTTLALRWDWPLAWRLGADARIGMGAAHAALAFVFMALLGALWSLHMRAGWHRHQQRISGSMLVVSFVILTVSAVGIYYLADETLSNFCAGSHLLIGALLVVPFIWHYLWHHLHQRSLARLRT